MSKSRPLPFGGVTAAYVAALEPGELFQTRRPIRRKYSELVYGRAYPGHRWFIGRHPNGGWYAVDNPNGLSDTSILTDVGFKCPYGVPGDTVWSREAYRFGKRWDLHKPSEVPERKVYFKLGEMVTRTPIHYESETTSIVWGRYRPAMFMPRWASRASATIVEVRAERVQEISEDDCAAEGIQFSEPIGNREFCWQIPSEGAIFYPTAEAAFKRIWDSFYRGTEYAWKFNGWAWVLTLRKEKADERV